MTPLKLIAIIIASLGGTGGVYATADHFGFRPAYIMEVREVKQGLTQIAVNVDWVRLENYERLLDRGGKLSRRECAEYRKIAKRLGVTPKAC
jgi:hypothetical protein